MGSLGLAFEYLANVTRRSDVVIIKTNKQKNNKTKSKE